MGPGKKDFPEYILFVDLILVLFVFLYKTELNQNLKAVQNTENKQKISDPSYI